MISRDLHLLLLLLLLLVRAGLGFPAAFPHPTKPSTATPLASLPLLFLNPHHMHFRHRLFALRFVQMLAYRKRNGVTHGGIVDAG